MLLVYITGAGLALYYARNHRWLAAAAAIYAGLVLSSVVFHQFVVYDRLARQMLPFICLAAAGGVEGWRTRSVQRPRSGDHLLFLAVVLGLSAMNSVPLFRQRFPREVVHDVLREYGESNVRLANTLRDVDLESAALFLPIDATDPETGPVRSTRYVLLNALDLWVYGPFVENAAPEGRVVFTFRHPRQLPGLQYHGYTPAQREAIRSIDVSIRLIDTQAPR